MKVRFTPQALVELDQILTEIADWSPQAASRVKARIQTIVDLLTDYPNSGQITNLRATRRLVATPYPYLVFYQPLDTEIIILGIRHSARDPSFSPE